jgi:heat shock protein HtpX
MVVGLVLMILAPIAAQLIYFAISRKREYLADASSALYTRYPEGLASALEKLGSSSIKLETANNATAPMYIVNPFRTQSLKAADLTSTHPPLSQRIRILRSMAGGASLVTYNEAFRKVRGGRGNVIGAVTLAAAEPVGLRAASEPEKSSRESPEEKTDRHREVADVLGRMNNYRTVTCQCGTKWKIPPDFSDKKVMCTRCGRMMDV